VLLGKPAIRGTRISVEFVLERLADGWTEQQLLENYPRLTHDDLTAVFSYVAECMKDGLLFETRLASFFEGRFSVITRSNMRQRYL